MYRVVCSLFYSFECTVIRSGQTPERITVFQTNQTHLVAPPHDYDSVYGQTGVAL